MITTVQSSRGTPCQGCPDRYPACSDHCTKPEFLAWKAEQKKIREAKRAYMPPKWQHEEPMQKTKFGPRRRRN